MTLLTVPLGTLTAVGYDPEIPMEQSLKNHVPEYVPKWYSPFSSE
jgi:hypothetical protein